jgi:hypothetical protein
MGALARRWGGAAPRLAAPAAMVTGLLAARGLRHRLGLGPGFSDTTWFADSLADALSMGVGMHWGSRLLGPGLVAMQENLSSSLMRTPPGLASRPGSSEPNWAYAAASASSPVRGAPALASILSEPGSVAPPASGVVGESSGGSMGEARWSRQIVASGGARHPFQLLTNPEAVRLWQPEGASLVGERIPIAEREGGTIAIRIQRHEVNREADPITPEGVTKLNFTVEEGETRGKVFAYFDREAVTLYFIDLEESMITGGPAMRRGAGSIVLTWLAEQAAAQGKVFQVTRITSDQTVKILRRQGLIDPSACVEACTRLRPESYDEEYRVDATFPFGDEAAWRLHARNAEFFNVLAKRNPAR